MRPMNSFPEISRSGHHVDDTEEAGVGGGLEASGATTLSASLSASMMGMDQLGDTSVAAKVSALVNQDDMEGLKRSQEFISARLIKTTDRLGQFNQFSSDTLKNQQWKFEQNTQVLLDLHKDLTAISEITRSLRQKLAKQYPEQARQATRDLSNFMSSQDDD
ncbi:kxDL motif-containing protein 1-like [Convolutriloba macropyga]|uniref:kxDL motif-containing protein 1-like n=1 Tax=Convolutriloba macropyga TaxID=536237 RepID=UPI003F51BBEA